MLHDFASIISSRTMDDDGKGNSMQLINVFISFNLFGLFGTIIMLLTVVFSRAAPRDPVWFSFAFSWIISAISYTLLFFAGRLTGPEPEYGLCLIQGTFVYAAPPLTAAATLALVIQIWFLVRSVVTATPSTPDRIPRVWSISLLIVPYIIHATIVVATFVVGLRQPSIVRRVGSGMYCNFSNIIPGRVSTILVTIIMIPTVVLEINVCIALHKKWALLRCQRDSLSMILRVMCFTLFGFLAIALSLVFFFRVHHGQALNIVISLLPMAVVLIFATQGDLIRAWMFWRRKLDNEEQEIKTSTKIHDNVQSFWIA